MNFYALFRCFCFSSFSFGPYRPLFYTLVFFCCLCDALLLCFPLVMCSMSREFKLIYIYVCVWSVFIAKHIRKFIQSKSHAPNQSMAQHIHWIYVKHNTYMHLFTQQIEHRNCLKIYVDAFGYATMCPNTHSSVRSFIRSFYLFCCFFFFLPLYIPINTDFYH